MSPEELAQGHSQIIDAKLIALKELFKTVNAETQTPLSNLFNQLTYDTAGRVQKTPGNRRLINKAIGLIKKKVYALRPVIIDQYAEGAEQINRLSTNYITGLQTPPGE